jgi:hypothetical protein
VTESRLHHDDRRGGWGNQGAYGLFNWSSGPDCILDLLLRGAIQFDGAKKCPHQARHGHPDIL